MTITKRTMLMLVMLVTSIGINAQVDLLRRFGLEPDDITPEMRAMVAAFLKHRFEVVGTVMATDDFEPRPYPLQGANVMLTCVEDTTQMGGAAVDKDGNVAAYIFCRNKLKDLRVRVRISYIGMETYDRIFTPVADKDVIGDKLVVKLDTVVLKSTPMTLAEAEVVGELQKMYQRGDTTFFNADAYETPSGSVLLDLVRRLPGLRYEGGELTYMGRSIEEMRLNGDPFFRHDISVALNNMPHDKIKSLKVYEVPDDTLDVMTDNHLVMDMQTKEAVRSLDFANAQAGITADLKNFLLALSGNTWVKNGAQVGLQFMTRDLPNGGQPTLRDVDTNVDASYEQTIGRTSIDAGLSHGYDRSDGQTEGFTQIFMPGFSQRTETVSRSSNKSHDYSGRVALNGNFGAQTRWRMRFDLRSSDSKRRSGSSNHISDDLGNLISQTQRQGLTNSNSRRANWDAEYHHFLDSLQRNEIGVSMNAGYSDAKSTTYSNTTSLFALLADSTEATQYIISSPTTGYNLSAGMFLNHRFGEKNNIRLSYGARYINNHNNQQYADRVGRIDSLSYDKRNHTMAQSIASSLLIDNKVINLKVNMAVEPTRLVVSDERMGAVERNTYNTIIYSPSTELKFKIGEGLSSVTLGYSGSNQLPSAESLSASVNSSDPMNIYQGNPNLKEAFRHTASMEWKYKALLRATLSYTQTDRQVTNKTIIDPTTGARRTTPENINGNRSLTSYLFLTKLFGQVSVNAIATHTYSNNVAYVSPKNYTTGGNWEATKSATKLNNYNFILITGYTDAHWIAGIMANYNLDHRRNEYMATSTNGQSVSTRLELRHEMDLGLSLQTNFTFQKHFGYELASANTTDYIWNAAIAYRFLKRKATLSLEWNDILDNNRGFSASMTDTQWSETRTLGKTSYLLLSFAYRFSMFN
ncbi:MAG: outer membrane beta-barrel protein [Bacteroidaceae bacterium]|nr:outer membrane beta-barrel protein [Bacteroidaceae bacterium]